MAKNYLDFQTHGVRSPIDDNRWRVNTSGMEDCRNATLVITDAIKAEGPHREGGWLKSGVPVGITIAYDPDVELNGAFMWESRFSGSHLKIRGFLAKSYKITDENGEFYDTVPVAVQTSGEVIYEWLPMDHLEGYPEDLDEFKYDLAPTFTVTRL